MTNKPTKVFVNPKKNIINKVNTYKARRTLTIFGKQRWPGELVPEAHTWLRVGNIEHAGYLTQVQVPESEFDAAVAKYCPDLTEHLAYKAKGMAVAVEHDSKFTGFQTDADDNIIDVAAQRRAAYENERADTAPNKQVPADHSQNTPQGIEERTPGYMHSDGGPTVWREDQDGEKAVAVEAAEQPAKSEPEAK